MWVNRVFWKYWPKTLLDDLPGGGTPPNNEKRQITVVQHPEISIFCGCNRFFFKFGGGRFETIGEGSVGVKLDNKERLVKNPGWGGA